MDSICPECGAQWQEGITCQDHFYQMLYWEAEDMPVRGVVHHYIVLCYHIQHPSILSQEWLNGSKKMLGDFLSGGVSTQEMRARMREPMDSGNRKFKIKATENNHGVYPYPVRWTMTAADVVTNGADRYVESVEAWARACYESLEQAEKLHSV